MNRTTKKCFLDFIIFAFWAFVLFFLSTELLKPTQELLMYMNDKNNHLTMQQWIGFTLGTVFFTIIWSAIWMLLKSKEKSIVDYIANKR